MKAISILLVLLSSTVGAQRLDVEGDVKIKTTNDNNKDSVLVTNGNGVIYYRDLSTMGDADADPANEIQNLREVLAQDSSAANKRIKDLKDPLDVQDAATKSYVDNMLLSFGVSIGSAGIQGLLNAGYCPLDIIAAGAAKDSLYGKTYQGGLIFYIDDQDTVPDMKGLVSAPIDQSHNAYWGCLSIDLPEVPNVTSYPPSGPGAEVGDGVTNTAAILSVCPTALAAILCKIYRGGGYRDWFLPSAKELDLMWENLADSDGDNVNMGPTDPYNLGGFARKYYYSSSESSSDYVWSQVFTVGDQFAYYKGGLTTHVRAVRAF